MLVWVLRDREDAVGFVSFEPRSEHYKYIVCRVRDKQPVLWKQVGTGVPRHIPSKLAVLWRE
jgi:hypothetical protein